MLSWITYLRNWLWRHAGAAAPQVAAGETHSNAETTEPVAVATMPSQPPPADAERVLADADGASVELTGETGPALAVSIDRHPISRRLSGAMRANRRRRPKRNKVSRQPAAVSVSASPLKLSARGKKRSPDLYPMKRRPKTARKPTLKVLAPPSKVRPSAMIIQLPISAKLAARTTQRLKKAA